LRFEIWEISRLDDDDLNKEIHVKKNLNAFVFSSSLSLSRRDDLFVIFSIRKRRVFSILFVKIPSIMWQEGQEEEDLFDDVPESFVLCALHQGVNIDLDIFVLIYRI
jgi:hypothetical protein